ncbi:MAG: hypothetical protein A3B79_03345 [Deltaproteobacteria bacterium RIFCSPHIGHO2_02_FULL_50_15]|nr:MAG: hypothetical protein A3B79_03345 [Deltaproteobacteria bacterium RIFCSPHIGHO2_02_FULL_50_15]
MPIWFLIAAVAALALSGCGSDDEPEITEPEAAPEQPQGNQLQGGCLQCHLPDNSVNLPRPSESVFTTLNVTRDQFVQFHEAHGGAQLGCPTCHHVPQTTTIWSYPTHIPPDQDGEIEGVPVQAAMQNFGIEGNFAVESRVFVEDNPFIQSYNPQTGECLSCHGSATPVRFADDREVTCLSCHQTLAAYEAHPPEIPQTACRQCHADTFTPEGTFTSIEDHFLDRLNDGNPDVLSMGEICASCHGKNVLEEAPDSHTLGIEAVMNPVKRSEYLGNIRQCGNCHLPVTSPFDAPHVEHVIRYLQGLEDRGPINLYPQGQLCTQCHEYYDPSQPEILTLPGAHAPHVFAEASGLILYEEGFSSVEVIPYGTSEAPFYSCATCHGHEPSLDNVSEITVGGTTFSNDVRTHMWRPHFVPRGLANRPDLHFPPSSDSRVLCVRCHRPTYSLDDFELISEAPDLPNEGLDLPDWNDTSGEASACGACHANPPPSTHTGAPHPNLPASVPCSACHTGGTDVPPEGETGEPHPLDGQTNF